MLSGRIALIDFVFSSSLGCIKASDMPLGTGKGIGLVGSSGLIKTIPPCMAGATLSGCIDPVTSFSPSNAQTMSSCLDNLVFNRESVAMTAATELAELPPIPPDKGRPFQISISSPVSGSSDLSRTAIAATPATFFEGSVGIPESILWIDLMITPVSDRLETSTVSPR